MKETWSKADDYYENLFIQQDPDLQNTLDNSNNARLFPIAVTPNQGKFLHMLVNIRGAKRILEIGTLGGYSAIWMAKALPEDGSLITLEKNHYFVGIAKKNIAASNVADKIEIIEGNALETLPRLIEQKVEAFDLIFIDANKADNLFYFEKSLKLSKKGTIIIADNVIRGGGILSKLPDPKIDGIKSMNERVAMESRVTACTLQTVGSKGYDGFSMILVTA